MRRVGVQKFLCLGSPLQKSEITAFNELARYFPSSTLIKFLPTNYGAVARVNYYSEYKEQSWNLTRQYFLILPLANVNRSFQNR